jgi:hypothetical protein
MRPGGYGAVASSPDRQSGTSGTVLVGELRDFVVGVLDAVRAALPQAVLPGSAQLNDVATTERRRAARVSWCGCSVRSNGPRTG